MGKKAKFKQLRRIAASMPLINAGHVEGEKVYGYKLIEEGIKELKDGTPIEPSSQYKRNKVVAAPLNHMRKMKQLYNQRGNVGVSAYINAVNRHVALNKAI